MKEPPKTEEKKIPELFRPNFGSYSTHEESSANKITKTTREEFSEVDYSIIKIILIIVTVSFLAFLFSYLLFTQHALSSLLAGIFFVSITTLLPLVLKSRGLHFTVSLISSVALAFPLFFFGKIPLIPSIVFAIVSTAILTEVVIQGKKELDNSLKVSFTKFSRRIISRTFTMLALAVAISYGWHFRAEELSSDWFINGAIFLSSPIINYYAPNFTPEMKFGEFLEISTRKNLAEKNLANFILMPETAKLELIGREVENSRLILENNLEINVNLESSFKENFRKAVAEKLTEPAKTMNPNHVSIIFIVIIFISIRGVLWFFGWLVTALSFFVFQLLLATKFAKVYLESRTKEIVVLK